ncbi:MAG: hypothetical protein ACOYT4_02170 [Nanoarchaeota archaeon]
MAKKEILVSITGTSDPDWQNKFEEIKNLNIKRFALFLERFTPLQRRRIYKELIELKIKNIPLIHIRNDMKKSELIFLIKNFNPEFMTIHESTFEYGYLKKWNGFYRKLFLELNFDNHLSKKVDVKKVGGFCIDLSHYKASEIRNTKEFEYLIKNKNLVKCNHLNGFSFETCFDVHRIKSLEEFEYLKTIPDLLYGKIIALETENGIREQLRFKEHLKELIP